ncbi:hypothetical protein RvY_18975 [Ramazzottius varieornatus]|uniref:A-kinase anchor protein 2 C-terminal domain-containing protein n=1 Tax=Ramazzottius varieornatus TaxID=947166 RepID=A0A1D1WBY5_RAMVA|nr:hypothetical protein RvY_18975 [Ramazzottius varieornatus]
MMDLIDFDLSSSAPRLVEVEMHPVSAAYHQHNHHDLLEPTKTGSFRRRDGEETPLRSDSSQERSQGYEDELDSSSDLPSYSPVPSESASVSWLHTSVTGMRNEEGGQGGHDSGATTPDLLLSSSPVGGLPSAGPSAGTSRRQQVSAFETSDYVGSSSHSSKEESHSLCSYSSASLPSTSPDLAHVPTPLPVAQDVSLGPQPALENDSASTQHRAKSPSPSVLQRVEAENETPIEREIRLAKRREEEVRRHNQEQRRKMGQDDHQPTTFPDEKKKQARWSVHIPLDKIPYNDTQRVLATTRLQQEIEEQKRREMELRRDGRVLSISEERVDHQPAHSPSATASSSSSDDNPEEETETVMKPRSDYSAHSTPPPHQGIRSQRAFFEQASPEGSATKAPIKQQQADETEVLPLKDNGHQAIIRQASQPKGGELPHSRESPHTAALLTTQTSLMTTTKMPLSSMQRFIANRGKLPGIVPSRISISKLTQPSSLAHLNDDKGVYVDYAAVRRPASQTQQDVPTSHDDNAISMVKKVYRSAKSKIFDELKEMERREEELRRTRQDLGLPDLSLELAREAVDGQGHSTEAVVRPQDTIVQEIAQIPVGRQSALLAQWEARINSAQAD